MAVSISVVVMVTIVTILPTAAKLSLTKEAQHARTDNFQYVLLVNVQVAFGCSFHQFSI